MNSHLLEAALGLASPTGTFAVSPESPAPFLLHVWRNGILGSRNNIVYCCLTLVKELVLKQDNRVLKKASDSLKIHDLSTSDQSIALTPLSPSMLDLGLCA